MSKSGSVLAIVLMLTASAPALAQGKKLGIGHPASPEQIAGWDIDVRPDGSGAPRYIRGVPTGPASPIVVAVTTSGDSLCAGVSYRTTAAAPDDIAKIQAHVRSRIHAMK